MGISRALQWWEEWQLRVLVLSSLFVYCILHFSFKVRSSSKLRRLKVVVWIAYIGSDAVAIYALATLFNRHKHTTTTTTDAALEVVWVPVLLIHLGGHLTISAYSLEDNELWKRQVITFLSQVTVALYVFCKWWSGEKRLLQAAVLLFIVGVFKYCRKPWALKTASFNSMLDSIPVSGGEEQELSLQEYVDKAKECVVNTKETDYSTGYEDVTKGYFLIEGMEVMSLLRIASSDVAGYIKKMLIDMSAPYPVRLSQLESFMKLDDKHAHVRLQGYLTYTFALLYSRMSSLGGRLGGLRTPVPSLTIASVVLFAMSNMDGYDKRDIAVTCILYSGNAIMEFLPFLLTLLSMYCKHFRPMSSRRWHDMVSQCNLMSFCAHKRKPTLLMKLAYFSSLREYLNMHWYIQLEPVACQITGLVRQHVKQGWTDEIEDANGYKRFNNIRRFDNQLGHLGWSSSVPFDHSVLLWHVATDLCFHYPVEFPQAEEEDKRRSSSSRNISNYMIYLLSVHPEMLMPGTRPGLFTVACNEVEELIREAQPPARHNEVDKEDSLAREIIRIVKSKPATTTTTYSVIGDACRLAKALMELAYEERWTLIQRMWVEMLCYSAVRCRGYLHAKSLGHGGECLTSIWLLLSFMGMETLADKLQRPQPSPDEDGVRAPLPFRSQGREDHSPENISLV